MFVNASSTAQGGDLVRAESLLIEATQLPPSAPQPWQNLAVVYDRMGRNQAAEQARNRTQELTAP